MKQDRFFGTSIYSEFDAMVYYPSPSQMLGNKMTFDNVVKKALTAAEISVRMDVHDSRELPDAVKSGNAKLRAIYE